MSFGGFWATVELMVNLDGTPQAGHPFDDDVEDWLENMSRMQAAKNDDTARGDGEDGDSNTEDDGVDYRNLVDCR